MDETAIKNRLVKHGKNLFNPHRELNKFTKVEGADRLLNDLDINRVYELMGTQNGINYYFEMIAILGVQPIPEYERLSVDTVIHGLKKALSRANKPYEDLE